MRLDEAILQYVIEQSKTDDSHTWFITGSAEEADNLVDTRYVEYGGWTFLIGYDPENRHIAMAYDHKFWDDYEEEQEDINLHHKYPSLQQRLAARREAELKSQQEKSAEVRN